MALRATYRARSGRSGIRITMVHAFVIVTASDTRRNYGKIRTQKASPVGRSSSLYRRLRFLPSSALTPAGTVAKPPVRLVIFHGVALALEPMAVSTFTIGRAGAAFPSQPNASPNFSDVATTRQRTVMPNSVTWGSASRLSKVFFSPF